MYRGKIEPVIVATWMPRSVLLRDHVERGGPWRFGLADNPGFLKRAELRFRDPKLFWIQMAFAKMGQHVVSME